jgi:hypothetical protein
MASYFLTFSLSGHNPTGSQWQGSPPVVVLSGTQGWWGGTGHGSVNVTPPGKDTKDNSWKFEVTISNPEPDPNQTLWFLGQLKLNDGTVLGVPVSWHVGS